MFVIRSFSGNVKSVWWFQINLAKFAKFWKKRSCGPNQPRKFLVVRNRPVTSCVAQPSGAAGVAVLHVWSAVFCEAGVSNFVSPSSFAMASDPAFSPNGGPPVAPLGAVSLRFTIPLVTKAKLPITPRGHIAASEPSSVRPKRTTTSN
eukprot:scaffold20328_cov116-Isochrysis_galbana.AAC.2